MRPVVIFPLPQQPFFNIPSNVVPDSDYRIKLQVFEGPLDLLLFLIRKNELDIYDIPIDQVTPSKCQNLAYR